jgi:Ca-activated chloride channel family protein
MSFIWPLMLLGLLLAPLLVWSYLRLLQRRQQAAAAWSAMGLVQSSSGKALGRRRHLPPLFYLLGLSLLLLGLARPQMAVSLPRVEGTVILAFDVSNSMAAAELEPTRMEAAKEAARAFVANQPSTVRLGVVAFSNGGLVVQPPSNEQTEILATIDRLSPQGGTSLGQGIFTSLNAIAGEPLAIDEADLEAGLENLEIGHYPSSVILLLSDGENTSQPDPLEIAQVAAEAGVRIYPVGIGSTQGAILQLEGFSILSQLNENTLKEIAGLTNGAYYHAADEASLQEIYENIDLRLTVQGEQIEVTALVAGMSLFLLLIGGALSMLWTGRVP